MFLGNLPELQHDTSGKLYAIDEKTFLIQDFQYDGLGPGESELRRHWNAGEYGKYYYMLNILAVYVYVYLKGVTVNRFSGGIIINWSPT